MARRECDHCPSRPLNEAKAIQRRPVMTERDMRNSGRGQLELQVWAESGCWPNGRKGRKADVLHLISAPRNPLMSLVAVCGAKILLISAPLSGSLQYHGSRLAVALSRGQLDRILTLSKRECEAKSSTHA